MPRVQFWAVDGEDLNADAGFIEVTEDGSVRISPRLEWVVEPDSMLPAWKNTTRLEQPTTPENGFRRVGEEEDGTLIYAPDPEDWDGPLWLDRVRYHFRTVYLRPGAVEE